MGEVVILPVIRRESEGLRAQEEARRRRFGNGEPMADMSRYEAGVARPPDDETASPCDV